MSGYILISDYVSVMKLNTFEKGFKMHSKNYDFFF